MTLTLSDDYTDRDFDALRLRLQALVRSTFPDWTDFDVASFGNTLVDLFAFVGDVLGAYQDAQARETRLVTATERRNIVALAATLGYQLHGARAATAELRIALSRPPVSAVTLPAGTIVRTEEVSPPTRFQLLDAVTFDAGADPPVRTAIVEHSRSHEQPVTATGLAEFEIPLTPRPFLDDGLGITTAAGPFAVVPTLLESGPLDRHAVVVVDDQDRATVRFGDGVAGAIPTGTVTLRYKTGGGGRGNVDRNTLVVLEGAFTDTAGRPVIVSVTNPEPASGGTDRETSAQARVRAPASLRALTRSVSREDFEINARRLPSVARALMLTSNEDGSVGENEGILYVVPTGGGLPTPALKNAVLRQVTEIYPCTLTFTVRVQDPIYKPVNVRARVFLRPGHTGTTVREAIRARLRAFFALGLADGTDNPRVAFGYHLTRSTGAAELAWSDLFDVVRDTPGVRKLGDARADFLLNGLPADVALHQREFPVLGHVELVDGDTGATL